MALDDLRSLPSYPIWPFWQVRPGGFKRSTCHWRWRYSWHTLYTVHRYIISIFDCCLGLFLIENTRNSALCPGKKKIPVVLIIYLLYINVCKLYVIDVFFFRLPLEADWSFFNPAGDAGSILKSWIPAGCLVRIGLPWSLVWLKKFWLQQKSSETSQTKSHH